jgi:hypothetical protein
MDFPPELQGLIIKIAARHNPKFLTLNKSLSWLAMEGLYQVVELKTVDQAISFMRSLDRNTLVEILNSTRVNPLPVTSGLINVLYLSFDIGRNWHFPVYKAIFRPNLLTHIPQMSSLREFALGISDGSFTAFRLMTNPNFTYPSSVKTVRIISVDVDGQKAS